MDKAIDRIVIGRFGRPHGIKGFITVHSFTDPRDNILRYTDWQAYINKQWQPLKLLHVEMNEKFILAQVAGYSEREQVAALTNVEIAVSRAQLPALEEGEYYWHELVGMQVVNQQGTLLGTVVEIMPTGANDVLIIEGEKRHLVPYLPGQFVADINPSRRIITVDWDAEF
ncbi:ribosome maturation factor RimM [Legionella jamestowniensis]|uniref:Ribosome maturation factor RimM n=1 Tax=Legionella jamestowniensis TaxID=455 RepID=A0A0W0UJL5_9GAMM|nr:ribosome maturation factor RimM [Legionella jamestowniensis]KTD08072.1 16S rRNA processing protein RimM [Legionella jamestowniensis]SFM05679.1 16S rRNA processing protein RimM [Legionella jamestowniensis DSM 19215]